MVGGRAADNSAHLNRSLFGRARQQELPGAAFTAAAAVPAPLQVGAGTGHPSGSVAVRGVSWAHKAAGRELLAPVEPLLGFGGVQGGPGAGFGSVVEVEELKEPLLAGSEKSDGEDE